MASNRRIKGPDGRVRATRYTATKDPALRAEPVGVIDPQVSLLSFWNEKVPLAVLSYYACHPQSYYRTGVPSPDFPGIARFIRGQCVPEALHVHFNGAGGNIGAGKYNDGSKENRILLAAAACRRHEAGLRVDAEDAADGRGRRLAERAGCAARGRHLNEAELVKAMQTEPARVTSPRPTSWPGSNAASPATKIPITCLRVGDARVLHLPGELFVEYQLAAKAMRPDLHVMMAAYGEYGPGYIGLASAYARRRLRNQRRGEQRGPGGGTRAHGAMRQLLGGAIRSRR